MALVPQNPSIPRSEDHLHRMHVTRPKSAKGRTRTRPQSVSHDVESHVNTNHVPSSSPRVPSSQSTARISPEDIPELLHHVPSRPTSSTLNRYRVLPSIRMSGCGGRMDDEEQLTQQTNSMRLMDDPPERQRRALYRDQALALEQDGKIFQDQKFQGSLRSPGHINLQEPTDEEPRLLLAIRSHSGQRFERYFRPTDTLHTVLAAAEETTGVSSKDCSVESMEVPRRSFPVLSWTLQQCGIPNKSVLCIHQMEMD